MSKITFEPNASGTGVFTIASPNSNTDRTLNLPDEAGTVLSSSSDIESQVKAATNASGSAPIYSCRAWVNFNGTGTVAIRDSGNVSSITDNGTGNYTVNFTTAIEDANYNAVFGCQSSGLRFILEDGDTPVRTTTALRIFSLNSANATVDNSIMSVAIFR